MAEGGGALQFGSIALTGFSLGKLKVTDSDLVWTPRAPDAPQKRVALKTVARARWAVFGRECHLRLFLRGSGDDSDDEGDGEALRFTGFAQRDRDSIASALAAANTKLGGDGRSAFADEQHYAGGANYGTYEFAAKTLTFNGPDGDDKVAFELDLRNVAQCVLPGGAVTQAKQRREVTLQFHESDAVERDSHQLVELRLFVPEELTAEGGDDEVGAIGLFVRRALARRSRRSPEPRRSAACHVRLVRLAARALGSSRAWRLARWAARVPSSGVGTRPTPRRHVAMSRRAQCGRPRTEPSPSRAILAPFRSSRRRALIALCALLVRHPRPFHPRATPNRPRRYFACRAATPPRRGSAGERRPLLRRARKRPRTPG